MSDDRPSYWFPAKRYGWGWGIPRTWQGWAVTMLYCLVVLGTTFLGSLWQAVIVVVATLLLLLVGIRKGEPTHWRWGGR